MAMGENENIFADANSNLEDAKIVILGVPFDGTSSHRTGSAKAPSAIRQESYNFEAYLCKYGFDIETASIHDMGDAKEFTSVRALVMGLSGHIREIIKNRKFLITLGGEHSLTVPIVKTLSDYHERDELAVIFLDAHLDFRNSYLDEKYSHACTCRRVTDLVGVGNVVSIGVRSYSKEEADAIEESKLRFYSGDCVNERGIEPIIHETLEYLGKKRVYLSIDMDVVDPAFAPGVGNPEYFGLNPGHIRKVIELLGASLIGADIVEVSPPYDNGNTAALAAQLVQIIISQAKID